MWSSRTAEVLEAEWVDTIGTGSYLGTHWWSVAPRKSGVSPTLTGWLSEARGPMGRLWGSERRWAVVTREIKNWSWWPFVAMTTDNLSSSKFVRANFILVLQRKREARKKVPSIWKRVVETLTAHPSFLGSVGKERCLCVHRFQNRKVSYFPLAVQALAFILWTWYSNVIRHKPGLPILRCLHLSRPHVSCTFPSLPYHETPLSSCTIVTLEQSPWLVSSMSPAFPTPQPILETNSLSFVMI